MKPSLRFFLFYLALLAFEFISLRVVYGHTSFRQALLYFFALSSSLDQYFFQQQEGKSSILGSGTSYDPVVIRQAHGEK